MHLSDGLVAICDEYHEALGGPSLTQRVLQVVPRSGALCEGRAATTSALRSHRAGGDAVGGPTEPCRPVGLAPAVAEVAH